MRACLLKFSSVQCVSVPVCSPLCCLWPLRAARGGGDVPRRGGAPPERHVLGGGRRARRVRVRLLDRRHLPAHPGPSRRHSGRRRAPLRAAALRRCLRLRLQWRRMCCAAAGAHVPNSVTSWPPERTLRFYFNLYSALLSARVRVATSGLVRFGCLPRECYSS